jgi:hypothetical protein
MITWERQGIRRALRGRHRYRGGWRRIAAGFMGVCMETKCRGTSTLQREDMDTWSLGSTWSIAVSLGSLQ